MSENEIGKKILARRKALGLTLEEVGNAVGVGKSTVRKWENGMIKNMGRDKIAALAEVLHMDPVEFVPAPSTKAVLPEIRLKVNKHSFAQAIVESGIKDQVKMLEHTTRAAAFPKVEINDAQTKSLLKLWDVATPDTRKAVIGVLKAATKTTKK